VVRARRLRLGRGLLAVKAAHRLAADEELSKEKKVDDLLPQIRAQLGKNPAEALRLFEKFLSLDGIVEH